MEFKFSIIGSNKSGNRIFCKLSHNKCNLIKGFYDFNLERFIIMKYMYDNFQKGITKKQAKEKLKEILKIDYNWEL